MTRTHTEIRSESTADRLRRMMLDDDILLDYRKRLAKLATPVEDEAIDNADGMAVESDLTPDALDISQFSDLAACQALDICSRNTRDGSVFFGFETDSGPQEIVFYDVCFVKNTFFPPLPDRRYKSPGTLYHSISLIAPPGEGRVASVANAIRNMYLRLSTASASRRFADFSPRTWTVDPNHGEQSELYLTSRVLTYTEDIKSGRVASKACSIPPSFDSNQCVQRLVDSSRGSLCFTPDNLFRVCDSTARGAGRSAVRYPNPDVVVSGQLVYVTFTIQASVTKPAGFAKGGPRGPLSLYQFTPTLKSLIILSKAGPMTMRRQAMAVSPDDRALDVSQDALPAPADEDREIERALRRLRLEPDAS